MVERVLSEVGEHLQDADRLAGAYAVAYVEACREGRRVRPPRGLRPEIARMVREVVLDAGMDVRLQRAA